MKQVLSRELQLYYNRLTTALLSNAGNAKDDSSSKRAAALSSLRIDAGLQALLPYLVRWVAEGVVNTLRGGVQGENDGRTLSTLLDVICAILDNSTLFVEPYVSSTPSASNAFSSCEFDPHLFYKVTSTTPADSVNSATFNITPSTRYTPPNNIRTNVIPPFNPTFNHVSFPITTNHEDTLTRVDFSREK